MRIKSLRGLLLVATLGGCSLNTTQVREPPKWAAETVDQRDETRRKFVELFNAKSTALGVAEGRDQAVRSLRDIMSTNASWTALYKHFSDYSKHLLLLRDEKQYAVVDTVVDSLSVGGIGLSILGAGLVNDTGGKLYALGAAAGFAGAKYLINAILSLTVNAPSVKKVAAIAAENLLYGRFVLQTKEQIDALCAVVGSVQKNKDGNDNCLETKNYDTDSEDELVADARSMVPKFRALSDAIAGAKDTFDHAAKTLGDKLLSRDELNNSSLEMAADIKALVGDEKALAVRLQRALKYYDSTKQ